MRWGNRSFWDEGLPLYLGVGADHRSALILTMKAGLQEMTAGMAVVRL